MRIIRSFDDVQKVINELLDWQNLRSTKNWDFHQLKITNASDGTEPRDYVTLEQLKASKTTLDTITKVVVSNREDQFFTIVFSKDGTVFTGDNSPAYIVGNGREGLPTQVWLACEVAPASAPLAINLVVTYIDPSTLAVTTANLLSTSLSIPIGSTTRVFSGEFTTPMPYLASGAKINKVVVTGGDAAYVSVGVVVKRTL